MSNANDLDFSDFFPDSGQTPSLAAELDLSWDEDGDGELANFFDDLTALEAESQGVAPTGEPASLAPPLWREYQTLKTQVACLQQTLEEKERQLREHPPVVESSPGPQEELSQALGDLQSAQEESQRQRLQLETLAQQLDEAQRQNRRLEQECKQLGWENQKRIQQIHDLEIQLQGEQAALAQSQQRLEAAQSAAALKSQTSFPLQPNRKPRKPLELPRFIQTVRGRP